MAKYNRLPCPECGKMIAENWLVRHLKAKHPRAEPEPEWVRMRDPDNYPEHLQLLLEALLDCEDRLSDGFGWYTSTIDGMANVLERLYAAARQQGGEEG